MKTRGQELKDFTKKLSYFATFNETMQSVSTFLKKHIPADRASIFIYDAKTDRLWSAHADNVDEINVPADMGLIGLSLKNKEIILENEPYGNSHFLADVDMQTGYYTQNTLSVPVFNTQKEIIAVLQLLNKRGGFTKADKHFIDVFTQKLSPYIEENHP